MSDRKFTPPNRPPLGIGTDRRYEVVIDSFIEVVSVSKDDIVEIESSPGHLSADDKILRNHPAKYNPDFLMWQWLREIGRWKI